MLAVIRGEHIARKRPLPMTRIRPARKPYGGRFAAVGPSPVVLRGWALADKYPEAHRDRSPPVLRKRVRGHWAKSR